MTYITRADDITTLPLSVRSVNCLQRAKILTIGEMIDFPPEELLKIRNMGVKSANEIQSWVNSLLSGSGEYVLVDQLPSKPSKCSGEEETINQRHKELVEELFSAYGQSSQIWEQEIISVVKKYPEASGETIIYRLYESQFVRLTAKKCILQRIEKNGNEISNTTLFEMFPSHLSNTTIAEELLLELENSAKINVGENTIRRQYPSITEYISNISDTKIRDVLQARLEGKTLQEIGDQYGITRERTRQIMQKGLRKKPFVNEDKYAYIYEQYDFSAEDFCLAFSEPVTTFNYLEMISKSSRSKKKPLEDILADTSIPPETRRKTERAIYKNYVSVNGVRVKRTRPALVKFFVKTLCKELTRFEDFLNLYNAQLEQLELSEDSTLTMDSRTYENIFNQCNYVLWNNWNSFRYYDIAGKDFEEFFSTLRLDQYENMEISTRKVYRDYPELMRQYDIQDEYELHNLLKKIWPQDLCKVNFQRMPIIEIGTANRDEQVLSLLLQYSPITRESLALKYEDLYGVREASVRGNFLKPFSDYFFNGIYSIDYAGLPSVQFDRMATVLNQVFYTIPEVKEIYHREFPNSDISLINPYTLKTLGFHVYPGYSGYVIKNIYSGATDYFNELLTHDDIVDGREISSSIRNLVTYCSELYRLRHSYEIIEYAPLRYINMRRLKSQGITLQHLLDYSAAVASFYDKGEFFTTKTLMQDGFSHPLDDLGFDEWFYGSLIMEDQAHFSYARLGKARVFLRGKGSAQLVDLLQWLLEKYQKIDIYDLVDLMNDRYGIIIAKDKIIEIVRNTEMYYDAIMEAVYIDYDTYFEEI